MIQRRISKPAGPQESHHKGDIGYSMSTDRTTTTKGLTHYLTEPLRCRITSPQRGSKRENGLL
jgi:hypothetical protein